MAEPQFIDVAPSPTAAGVALVAADTGRVLMLQRALIDGEPAGGKWEFPGGNLDPYETAWEGASREFSEEVGHELPAGGIASTWLSSNGVYQGFVFLTPVETPMMIDGSRSVQNPDDPAGNYTEACAWFVPADLDRGPRIVREEARSTPWSLLKGYGAPANGDAIAASADTQEEPEMAEAGTVQVDVQTNIRKPVYESLVASLDAPGSVFYPEAELPGPTPWGIQADGRTVDGHLALWASCHIGYPGCVTPPREDTFDFFNLGEAVTADGARHAVGKVTISTGHAGPELNWRTASAHYDESGSAVAVVRATADRWGIRLPGAVVASATPDQVDEARRSPLSGDWRRINGRLRLVAALGVNVPGYPVPRALVAAGEVESMFVGFDPADVAAAVAEADSLAAGLGLDPAGRAASMRRELLGS